MANLIRIERPGYTYEVPATAKEFAYDGCHKCYIIETEEDKKTMKELGWYDDQFFPLSELPKKFDDSCPFRFINNASLTLDIVPQGEEYVSFVFDDGNELEYFYGEDDDDDFDYEEEEGEDEDNN